MRERFAPYGHDGAYTHSNRHADTHTRRTNAQPDTNGDANADAQPKRV